MLFDINNNRVNNNPHQEEFSSWCSRISDPDLQAMEQAINSFCNRVNEFRSSFIPGQDNAIKELFPVLTAACNGNEEHAGLFFGNIIWRVLDRRSDNWYFKLPDKDDEYPLGTFYWKRNI